MVTFSRHLLFFKALLSLKRQTPGEDKRLFLGPILLGRPALFVALIRYLHSMAKYLYQAG